MSAVTAVAELSCYTTALHRYLSDEWDADRLIAPGIHLAVAVCADDRLVFSHHRRPLDQLPDGTVLRYRGARTAEEATAGLQSALDADGRVVVQVDLARLRWSPRWSGAATPHWLLVEGRRGDRWQVHDPFRADLVEGTQRPHRGNLTREELLDAVFSPGWTPVQRDRSALVFGHPVPVPEQPALWLRRSPAEPEPPATQNGREQLSGLDGLAWTEDLDAAVRSIGEHLEARRADVEAIHDDLWAAGRHRTYALLHEARPDRCREAVASVVAGWAGLSRATYLAVEAARRDRRSRLPAVLTALQAIRTAERELIRCR